MAEYALEDEVLEELKRDMAAAGMAPRAQDSLMGRVMQNAIAQRRRDSAASQRIENKATTQQQFNAQRQDEFLNMLGPQEEPEPEMPITYGANPRTGVRAWNNMGWIADQPEQIASLDPRQREVARRYNSETLAKVRGNQPTVGAPGGPGGPSTMRDPFMPPPEVMGRLKADEMKQAADLRLMGKLTGIMTQMKIPAPMQDMILYQRFPNLARRKVEEDFAIARGREQIQTPRRDADRDVRTDANQNLQEYRTEQQRMQAERDLTSQWRAYETAIEAYRALSSLNPPPDPKRLEAMGRTLAEKAFDISEREQALINSRKPGAPSPTDDPENTGFPPPAPGGPSNLALPPPAAAQGQGPRRVLPNFAPGGAQFDPNSPEGPGLQRPRGVDRPTKAPSKNAPAAGVPSNKFNLRDGTKVEVRKK